MLNKENNKSLLLNYFLCIKIFAVWGFKKYIGLLIVFIFCVKYKNKNISALVYFQAVFHKNIFVCLNT